MKYSASVEQQLVPSEDAVLGHSGFCLNGFGISILDLGCRRQPGFPFVNRAMLQSVRRMRGGPFIGWRARGGAAAVLLATSAMTVPALAGNLDSYYLGSDAALDAGAVTADTRGGGAIWYNPAGLARVAGARLDVGASAYSLHFGGQPDFSGGSPDTEIRRLTSTDIKVVATALATVWRAGPIGLGLGVFVPRQEEVALRTQVFTRGAGNAAAPASEFGIDVLSSSKDYYAGLAVGVAPNRRVSIGASLFAVYRTELSTAFAEVGARSGNAQASLATHSTLDWRQIGAQLVLGLQLEPRPDWDVGFTFRLPSLRIYELRQDVNAENLAATDGDQTAIEHSASFERASRFSHAFVDPLRFHAGVAHATGAARLGVDVSYQVPFRDAEVGIDWKPTLNARVGGHYRLDSAWTIGGGLFTDRSPVRAARAFGESDIGYYGVTLSLDTRTTYETLARVDANAAPSASGKLEFGTCVALSYAVGFGRVVRGSVDFTDGAGVIEVAESAVAHEVLVHVSSSLGR